MANLSLPESIQVIGDFAFYGCSALTELTIPRSVITIGYNAFDYCDGLSALTWNAINCTTNGDMTTYNLSQVNIGNEVKKLPIGLAANSQITSISIPNSVDSICSRAFEECESLLKVDIPNSAIYIGDDVFSNCMGLTDVIIPDQVTRIGDNAFRNCTNLMRITIGASVDSIGYGAFGHCTSLQKVTSLPLTPPIISYSTFSGVSSSMIVYVHPSALENYQSDYYWNKFTIEPANFNVSNLTVELPNGIDVSKYDNMKLIIRCLGNDYERHLVMNKKKSYTFSALDKNTSWELTLKNQYGDEFGKIENVEIGEEDITVSFSSLKSPHVVTMTVNTPDDLDVTDHSRVSWYDENGDLLVQGNQITGLPAGRQLLYSVRLPQQMATKYSLPDNMAYTVKEGNNNVICQLSAIRDVLLSGVVKEAEHNQPLYGASISLTQSFAGGHSNTLTSTTDYLGSYSIHASSVPTTMTIAAPGYKSQTLNCDELMTGANEINLPNITLQPLSGVVVNVKLTYTPAHAEGEEVETQNWYSDYNNVDYEIYNVTAGRRVTNINLRHPQIVLMEDINDGDVLELTATSRSDAFMPVKTNVTVSEQRATATFNILERGKLIATYNRNINPVVAGTLYQSNANIERIGEYSDGSLTIDNLDEGEYTLITMGEKDSYNSIYSLDQFDAVGLEEGSDYVKSHVQIKNGIISKVSIDRVPYFEPDGFVTGYTSFTVNKPSLVIGNFQTFRAQVDLKEQYANLVSDVKLIVDLPESCSFIENSVQMGSSLAEYSTEGNRITIPIAGKRDIVRLCAIPTESGVISPSAYVQFSLSGETMTVPIGNAKFTADALSINAPSTMANSTIPVSGTAIGQCHIDIYDNDVLIGQTTSLSDGIWSATCELYEPYSMSWHDIHAKVTTDQGLTLLTENSSCLYDMDAIQVKKVKMYHYNPQTQQTYEVEYDFQNPTNERQSWVVYYPKKVFTFTIDFTNNSPDILSNVVLYVHTADGSYLPYYAEYDNELDLWVVNCDLGSRSDGKYPVNVSIDFDANININTKSVLSMFDGYANQVPITDVKCQSIQKQGEDIVGDYLFGNSKIKLTYGYRSVGQLPTGIEFEQDTIFDQIIYTSCNFEENVFTVLFPREFIDLFSSLTNEKSKEVYHWADSICTNNYLQISVHIDEENLRNENSVMNAAIKSSNSFFTDETLACYMNNDSQTLYSYNDLIYLSNNVAANYCLPSNYQEAFYDYLGTIIKPFINKQSAIGIGASASVAFLSLRTSDMVEVNIIKHISSWLEIANELSYSTRKRNVLNAIAYFSNTSNYSLDSNLRSGSDCNPNPHPDKPGRNKPNRPNDDACIDPSGFVYEGVPSNRLEGVTATCYYQETVEDMYGDTHEEVILWDAEQYGQENPLLTDDYGYYHWDVPVGMWQVKYEKAGYETTYSDWLPVPPPQLQVNIGMVQMRQPEVIMTRAYPKAVEFEFDKYMLPEDLTTQNIKVTNEWGEDVSGTIEFLNAEVDDPNAITSLRRAPGTGGTFVSKARFNAYRNFYCDEVTLHVSKRVKSYANLEMSEDYEVTLPIEYEMDTIAVDTTLTLPYGNSCELTVTVLPTHVSRGKTLSVKSVAPMIATTDAETYTLDDNGQAVITVHGDLPGMTSLLYSIEDYDLTAATLVNVMMESQMTVATPTASILSGNEVEKGTAVYLQCATEGATIYYTLDGSCPCDPTPARKVYDGNPIIINGNIIIKAMATAPDLYDSDVATFVYRVGSGIKGDVNNDGEVNIADVNAIIGIILGIVVDDDIIYRADVNGDSEINIADVNEIIRIILGTSRALHYNVNCDDALHLNDVQLRPGEVRTLNVTLDNAERYSALQCDIVLPSGLTLVDVNCSNGRVSKTGVMNDSTTRAMFYSMNRHQFTSNGSPVITLTVRADATLLSDSQITLTNSVLADNHNKAWYIADCAARVNNSSGINDLTAIADRVWVDGHTLFIETSQDGIAQLTMIDGVVRDISLKHGINQLQLERGIYIVVINGNSHKIAIK